MNARTIIFGCYDYDRVQPLLRGDVSIPGVRIAPVCLPSSEIFPRALLEATFDVTEISAGSYLMQLARGQNDYIAIPVPVSRAFRHGAIYVRSNSGIARPKDLEGRRVGIPSYQFTAGLWVRGILQDEFSVDIGKLCYRTAEVNRPGAIRRPPSNLPPSIDVEPLPEHLSLSSALAEGEIDALISPDPPMVWREDSGVVRRLFPDHVALERAYFAKTGYFPTMHLLGIRKDVAEACPSLPAELFRALVEAKAIAMREMEALAADSAMRFSLPWLAAELHEVQRLGGRNFWPYGVERNRREWETMCRYAQQQMLTERQLSVEELFHPATLELKDDFATA